LQATNDASEVVEKKGKAGLLYEGTIAIDEVESRQWEAQWGLIPAATTSERLPWRHTVHFPKSGTLSEKTILHELCHAKLNESGFLDVQDDLKTNLSASHKGKIDGECFKETLWCVAEAYAEWLCYASFPVESKSDADSLATAIESPDALLNAFIRGGVNGFGEIASTQAWLNWCGIKTPNLKEPWLGWTPMKFYLQLRSLFGNLPVLKKNQSLEPISIEDKAAIIYLSVSIYECLDLRS